MGALKDEISAFQREMRGKGPQQQDSNKWYKSSKSGTGDSSVSRTNEVFKPGKIYSFTYANPVRDDKIWDRTPVVLSLGRIDGYDVGINLNLLSSSKRLDFLDRVYTQYKKKIDRAVRLSGNDAVSQNEIKSMYYENIKRFLESSGYMNAFRRYISNRRTSTYVFGYQEWKRVATLEIGNISGGDISGAQI
jgi:hypothetical protein